MDHSKAILPSMEARDLGNGLSANVDEHGTICLTTSDGKQIWLEASMRIALAQFICEVLLAQTKAEHAITISPASSASRIPPPKYETGPRG